MRKTVLVRDQRYRTPVLLVGPSSSLRGWLLPRTTYSYNVSTHVYAGVRDAVHRAPVP